MMRLRSLLRDYGVVRAELKNDRLSLSFNPKASVDLEKLMSITRKEPEKYKFGKNLCLSITIANAAKIQSPAELIEPCLAVLNDVARRK